MGSVTPASSAEEPPLARLFAIGYRMLIDGLHDRLRARGWSDVRPAFGFVLLAARDQPTSVSELAEVMGTTKQAASKLVETKVEVSSSAMTAGPAMVAPGAMSSRR